MPDITPTFVTQYERRIKTIAEKEYARKLAAENTWWTSVLRTRNIEGRSERITWLLNTAMIEPLGPNGSGNMIFENLVTQSTEIAPFKHGKGIVIQEDQLEDLNGTGLQSLSEWAEQISIDAAYYPQRLGSQLILNGAATDGSANAYDGKPFFADNSNKHPNNPFKTSLGGYANWMHGAASGAYPGALPIDNSVTTDVALANLGKLIAYIASLKMPNGVDPRFLMPKILMVPPALAPRARQLTDAKIIAQAAASGGGGADVEALISGWALGKPVVAQEFAASTTYSNIVIPTVDPLTGAISFKKASASGSDTTYYLICQEMQTTQLGGLLYVNRKPFQIKLFGPNAIPELDRAGELHYQSKGRMSVQYGHPYTVFRIDAS
jgi:hypothetical protein